MQAPQQLVQAPLARLVLPELVQPTIELQKELALELALHWPMQSVMVGVVGLHHLP